MNEYELIYEELCERVECGELSLEDAEVINDVAYDRYVNEANVYDKLVDKHVDAANKSKKKYYKIMRAQKQYDPNSREYKALDEIETRNQYKMCGHEFNPSLNINPYDIKRHIGGAANVLRNKRINDSEFYRKFGEQMQYSSFDKFDHENYNHATRKKEWMKQHGNVGQTPEERYKAGRYNFN